MRRGVLSGSAAVSVPDFHEALFECDVPKRDLLQYEVIGVFPEAGLKLDLFHRSAGFVCRGKEPNLLYVLAAIE